MLGSPGVSTAPAQETFRWHLEEGESYALAMKLATTSTARVAGDKYVTVLAAEQHNHWEVTAVDADGTATIEQTVERAVVDLSKPDGSTIHFDTADGLEGADASQQQLLRTMCPLFGSVTEITMNGRGEIIQFAILPDEKSGDAAPQADPAMTEILQNGFIAFPEASLNEGENWRRSFRIPMPVLELECDLIYTYTGSEPHAGEDLATFEITSELPSAEVEDEETDAPPARVGGMSGELEDMDSHGTIWFNAEAGRLVETRLDQKLAFSIAGPGGDAEVTSESEIRLLISPLDEE